MRTPPTSGSGSRPRARRVPKKTRWWWTTPVLILLILLGTAGYLGRFGIKDLNEALSFTGRMTGAGLVVASAAALFGGAAVMDYWFRGSFPHSGMVALAGTVAASLSNLMVLLEVLDGDSPYYMALSSLLTVGSAWAAFAVWRALTSIPAPKRVATAVIASSVFAIANFGYQNLYQPSQHGARPVIKLVMGEPELSMDRKSFAVPVDITLENHGDVGFYIMGAEFHAMGQKVPVSTYDRLQQQWRDDAEQWWNSQERSPLSRREEHETGQLLAAQPWMLPGGWIEASDSFAMRTVLQLPIDTPYDQVAFYATASLARKDRLSLDTVRFKGYSWSSSDVPQWVKERKETDSVIYYGRVRENNSINELTMDPRFVSIYWNFGKHGANVDASIARKGEEDIKLEDRQIREVNSRYGLVTVVTGPIQRSLWDIKSKIRQ
ncbi:Yip1 family protein [Streptomyces sp. NPDC051366]|uniref:Yip1 family protein n=1 Tax=Streptomyces sp. NPDC051366 TaxID=3365652 RepID=UPI0037890FE1